MNSPSSSTDFPELWAGIATAAAAAFLFLKKLVSRKVAVRKVADCQVPVTRAEFKSEMEAMRNRIGASHIALAEKIDANHKEVLSTFERRIDQLESNFARLDERTKAL